MSLIARLVDFQAGTIIASQPFDDEFNQLVNMLNGITQDKSIRVRNNDASFACGRFDQLNSANDILELFSGGAEKARFEFSGKLKSLVVTGVAPIDVDSTTVCPNLNADLIDGIDGANIAKLDTHVMVWEYSWFIPDPSTFAINSDDLPVFHAPQSIVGKNFVSGIRVNFATGSHTLGGSLEFRLFHRTAASGWAGADMVGAAIFLNNTNNAVDVVYTVSFTPVGIAPGDSILAYLFARSGTITERNVSISMFGRQGLI